MRSRPPGPHDAQPRAQGSAAAGATPKVAPHPEAQAAPKREEPAPPARMEAGEAAAKLATPRVPEAKADGAEVVDVHVSDRVPEGDQRGAAEVPGWEPSAKYRW